MPLIEWKDEFNTGNPSIDQEHRELIGLINDLHEILRKNVSTSDETADFLGEIYSQISAHFALEEQLMREEKYEDYTGHKTDHDRLLDDLRDIMDGHHTGSFESMEQDLSNQLEQWFSVHFSTFDIKLHNQLGH
ncbi:MAG: bacteriohemerythrin [bacterium]|nr:bacteriohemerythrin [bacterium]